MATDIEQIVRNLTAFYDFADRTVIAVGAGGGQLVEYGRRAGRVIAIDQDAGAIGRLALRLREYGLADKFAILQGDLLTLRPRGDVVLFEFCLHEMPDPELALDHAAQLAPDVVVIDHAPDSRWAWYAAEEHQVEAAWTAVARRSIRRRLDIEAFQHFHDFAELEAKMAGQGPKSRERIGPHRGQKVASIPVPRPSAELRDGFRRGACNRNRLTHNPKAVERVLGVEMDPLLFSLFWVFGWVVAGVIVWHLRTVQAWMMRPRLPNVEPPGHEQVSCPDTLELGSEPLLNHLSDFRRVGLAVAEPEALRVAPDRG